MIQIFQKLHQIALFFESQGRFDTRSSTRLSRVYPLEGEKSNSSARAFGYSNSQISVDLVVTRRRSVCSCTSQTTECSSKYSNHVWLSHESCSSSRKWSVLHRPAFWCSSQHVRRSRLVNSLIMQSLHKIKIVVSSDLQFFKLVWWVILNP